MTDFLVLFKTGPGPTDLDICDVIQAKKPDEAEAAIKEAATRGEGDYVAVPLDKAVRLTAQTSYALSPTPDEPT